MSLRLLTKADFSDYKTVAGRGKYSKVKYTQSKEITYSREALCSLSWRPAFDDPPIVERVIFSSAIHTAPGSSHAVPKARQQAGSHALSKEKSKDVTDMLQFMPAVDAVYMKGLCIPVVAKKSK